jgi:exopolyphosphatase/guanosine-5'-triphosphate,3'-diphosphate pyrophosphatase
MIVALADSGELKMVDRSREMVRLASGLDKRDRLEPEARERALACLGRFGERIADLPPANVRIVGTNTLRRMREHSGFLEAARESLGHPVEIISGIEEARLIFLGVARSLADQEDRRLVVDIGGGSTELIVGERSSPLDMESLYMGCVGSSLAHFPHGKVSAQAWKRARIAALQELEPIEARFRHFSWQEAVGSSGTVRAVGRIVRQAGWSERGITREALAKLRDEIVSAGRADADHLAGLSAQRAPVFAGGVAILEAIFEALDLERMRVADGALREGVLYDLLGRISHEDTRSRTVQSLLDRYHVDRQHAEQVETTARQLLEQAREPWKLEGEETQRVLGWAALLHEIGLDIAHAHYHRHGSYIVESSDLPGFSLAEQEMIAGLVRAHRRKFPLDVFKGKPKSWLYLAVLLRLAALLHRSHARAPAPQVKLKAGKRSLKVRFEKGWLDEHPLTHADLEQEALYLAAADFKLIAN